MEKIPGVELIMTRLHAGGKFSNKNYQYSGGLHGVGVSVVNALSKNLEVWIRRDGKEYNLSFRGGKKSGKLDVVGKVGKQNTGTTIRFWPTTRDGLLALAKKRLCREFTASERKTYAALLAK